MAEFRNVLLPRLRTFRPPVSMPERRRSRLRSYLRIKTRSRVKSNLLLEQIWQTNYLGELNAHFAGGMWKYLLLYCPRRTNILFRTKINVLLIFRSSFCNGCVAKTKRSFTLKKENHQCRQTDILQRCSSLNMRHAYLRRGVLRDTWYKCFKRKPRTRSQGVVTALSRVTNRK